MEIGQRYVLQVVEKGRAGEALKAAEAEEVGLLDWKCTLHKVQGCACPQNNVQGCSCPIAQA